MQVQTFEEECIRLREILEVISHENRTMKALVNPESEFITKEEKERIEIAFLKKESMLEKQHDINVAQAQQLVEVTDEKDKLMLKI